MEREPERTYTRICPVCGKVNRDMYLKETGGVYECERCRALIRTRYPGMRKAPDTGSQNKGKTDAKGAGKG